MGVMEKGEPPSSSCSKSSLFLVGKDLHGHWVVQDQSGRRGGLFIDRAEALKYAMFENGNRPQAVIMVPGVLELDISRKEVPAGQLTADTTASRERRVA